MGVNVKIPLSLFYQTLDLLEQIDVIVYLHQIRLDYKPALSAFRSKKHSLDLRRSYADIIFAEDNDKQFDARMKYLYDRRNG